MTPLPAPTVPGNTDSERFHNAVGMLVRASKTAVLKAEAQLKLRRKLKQKISKKG
jgi:hypothetical protein